MDWTQFALFFIGVFGLFLWNRAESRSDIRQITSLISAMSLEMKDFHGRLCTIEEKNKSR
jgi:hypothetical protein